jgi:O-succinylbenzoic acid--CoA ligase
LRTRDIVRLWDHGTRRFLEFVGRESGYVKILGELIHLAPLQRRLEELALEAHWEFTPVVGAIPDLRRETVLVLVTEERGSGDAKALLAAFNEAIEPLCHLQRVIAVDAIPRTALGKVDAAALQSLLRALP